MTTPSEITTEQQPSDIEQRIAKIKAALCRYPFPRDFGPPDVAFLLDCIASVPAQIEAARAEEREKCACLADSMATGDGIQCRRRAESIAAAIRARGEKL